MEAKQLTKEEVEANRSSAYEYLDLEAYKNNRDIKIENAKIEFIDLIGKAFKLDLVLNWLSRMLLKFRK